MIASTEVSKTSGSGHEPDGVTNTLKYNNMTIKFKKLTESAVIPFRSDDSGAGYNLTVDGVTTEVNQRGQIVIVYHSGIMIEVPEKYEATIRPANSIAKKTIRMCDAPSVLDKGPVEVVGKFIVTTDVIPSIYEKGEVFAQLVINKKESVDFKEIVEQKSSAAEESQSLPENEGEPINSESRSASGGEQNVPEEA